jgi:hypothetical protein
MKKMKIKRVGTLTFGASLISLGILIFISQISDIYTLDLALKLWPLVLILLGVEILWYRFMTKDDDVVIKYDILSIFLVFTILFTNLALYAMLEIGIIDKIKASIM